MRRLAAILLVTTVAVAGCGGDDDDDAAGDDTTTTTEADVEETTTTTEADVEETTTTEAARVSSEETALEIYVREILRWPDAAIEAGTLHEFAVTSPTFGTADVTMAGDDATGWRVDTLDTFDEAGAGGSVKLGFPDGNSVAMAFQDPDLTPDLTIAYGDGFANLFVRGGEPGGPARWDDIELDPTLDNGPRRVTVMWRIADGSAVEAAVLPVPAGEFAAG